MSYCDIEGPAFFVSYTRTARKEYECCECRTKIKKGSLYRIHTGKWEDCIDSFRQHLMCEILCVTIRDEYNYGECLSMGELDAVSDLLQQYEFKSNHRRLVHEFYRKKIRQNGYSKDWKSIIGTLINIK